MSDGEETGVREVQALLPHAGHRERLRDRARISGFAGMPDYELLELFLFRSIPQRDVKPLAKALLARFGSLGAVMAASEVELRTVAAPDSKGRALRIGPEVALDLRALHEISLRAARATAMARTVISSWTALLAYVRQALAHEAREQFRVLYLDTKNQLILDEVMNRGTVDHAPVYPREIMRRALELSAKAVILVHNHPSGDPTRYLPFPTFGAVDLNFVHPPTIVRLVTIGDHVRKRRNELGLTQALAAASIGICRDALARWEAYEARPDLRNMPAVVRFLGYNPEPQPKTFADLLRRTRRALGLNLDEFGVLLGVPSNTLHTWEKGRAPPPLRREAIAARCGAQH